MQTLEHLIEYTLRLLPAVICAVIFLITLPRKALAMRIVSYIMIFIFMRDAMTPLGLWSLGREGFLWIRFSRDPWLLILLGLFSAAIVFLMNRFENDMKALIIWFKGAKSAGVFSGIAGGVIIALPVLVIYRYVPVEMRGSAVPLALLPAAGVFSLLGNFYEETLFRGYFQGYMEKHIGVSPLHAAVVSGIMFSFCHVFLATTVTGIGYPLLVFTMYEGIIAGLVRMRCGLIPAALAHGTGIFIIASGVI